MIAQEVFLEILEVVILVTRVFLKPTPATLAFRGKPRVFRCRPIVDSFRCRLGESTYSLWGHMRSGW